MNSKVFFNKISLSQMQLLTGFTIKSGHQHVIEDTESRKISTKRRLPSQIYLINQTTVILD